LSLTAAVNSKLTIDDYYNHYCEDSRTAAKNKISEKAVALPSHHVIVILMDTANHYDEKERARLWACTGPFDSSLPSM
jgi:hypothetical protein